MKKELIDLLSKGSYKPEKFKEISRRLRVSAVRKREFRDLVRELLRDGTIVELPGRKYALAKEQDLLEGELKIKASGLGLVEIKGKHPMTIQIPDRFMRKGYLPGDRVLVQVDQEGYNERIFGRVVKVLRHSPKLLAGIYHSHPTQRWGTVDYIDHDAEITIRIPNPPKQELDNCVVLVRPFDQTTPNGEPEGAIEGVLGSASDPKTDLVWLHHRFDLPKRFSEIAETEAHTVAASPVQSHLKNRIDLRDQLIVTIDGEDARDFDDAVGIAETDFGYRLWISIADVSHYVQPATALYTEAFQRANSTYFPDSHIPMLPLELASDICSLKEDQDRLTITVEVELNLDGTVRKSQIYPSVIRSSKRLTYTQVYEWLSSQKIPKIENGNELIHSLRLMANLCQKMRQRRFERGALNLDIPESRFKIDRSGHVTDVFLSENNLAHQLIEEFMLLANETVAETLAKKGAKSIYRIHEEPDETKIIVLNQLLKAFGIESLDDIRDPKAINELVEQIAKHPCGKQLQVQLLRCMKQARYSPHNVGHFGLASEIYSHFTSPIRRFSDLIVHQILRAILFEKKEPNVQFSVTELEQIGEHLSIRERETMEAEREYEKLKKGRFLEHYVGRRMTATVVSITSFGLFAQLDDYPIEGLIRLSTLQDDYYRFHEESQSLIGQRNHKRYRLGQKILVTISEVDVFRRRIRFMICQSGDAYRGRRRR